MDTYQIAEAVLESYKNDKISDERIKALTAQANEQLDEIAQNKELYESLLKKVNAPEEIDKLVLWILFMSNETIVYKYINEFKKDFRKIIPVSDLADLLFYLVYLNKVKKVEIDGFDYLLEYEEEGIDVMDQFSVTNAILYIQKSKEVQIDFSF